MEIANFLLQTMFSYDPGLREKVINVMQSLFLRGYCTPGQFLDCFCIFLKNYKALVTSKICFL